MQSESAQFLVYSGCCWSCNFDRPDGFSVIVQTSSGRAAGVGHADFVRRLGAAVWESTHRRVQRLVLGMRISSDGWGMQCV